MSEKVLLTGAGGAIGKNLFNALTKTGITTFGLSRGNFSEDSRYRTVDLEHFNEVLSLTQAISPLAIVHLAHAKIEQLHGEVEYITTNLTITQNILEVAAKNCVSEFIFASSAAVYGDCYDFPASESTKVNPQSKYAELKIMTEDLISFFCKENGIKFSNLRLFNVYGDSLNDSLINRISNSSESKIVRLQTSDDFVRDYIHVDDVTDAICKLLKSPQTLPEIVNIGTGVPTTNNQLYEMLPSTVKTNIIKTSGKYSYSVANVSKLKELISFDPIRLTEYFANI